MNPSSTVQHVVGDNMGAWPNPATENQTNPAPITVTGACDIIHTAFTLWQTKLNAHDQKFEALQTQVSTLVDKLEAVQRQLNIAMDRLAAQDARVRELERQELLERQERQERAPKRQRTGVVATIVDMVDMVDSALKGSPK